MVGLDVGTGDDLFATGDGRAGFGCLKGLAEVVFAGFAATADEQNGVADETLVIFLVEGFDSVFPWAFGGKNPNAQGRLICGKT